MASISVVGEYARFTISVSFVPESSQSPQSAPNVDPAQQLLSNYLDGESSPGLPPLNWVWLKDELRSALHADMGEDVDLDAMLVRSGSLEIIVIAATAYKVVKNFNDVLDTIQKTAERLREIVRDFLKPLPVTMQHQVTATARPGSGLISSVGSSRSSVTRRSDLSTLDIYLAVSNIVLIIGLLVFLGLRS